MRQKTILRLVSAVLALAVAPIVPAVCPVCTVAVGTGIGLSRWLGVDDAITGLWLGGMAVSLILWTVGWLDDRGVRFPGREALTALIYYFLVIAPLYLGDITGQQENTWFGIDKLVLGIVIGSACFWGGAYWYKRLKAAHHGHAHFPFQKVVMPVTPLILLSVCFYFLLKGD